MAEASCAVCLNRLVGHKDELLKDVPVVAFIGCGHVFHLACVKQACDQKGVKFDQPYRPAYYAYHGPPNPDLCPTCPCCSQRAAHCKDTKDQYSSHRNCGGQHPSTSVFQRLYFSGDDVEVHFARDFDLPERDQQRLSVAEQAALFGIDLDSLEKDKAMEERNALLDGPNLTVDQRAGIAANIAETEWYAGGYGTETFERVVGGDKDQSQAAAVKACVLEQIFAAQLAMEKMEPKLKEVLDKALDEHSTQVLKHNLTDLTLSLDRLTTKLQTTPILLKMNRLLIECRKREDKLTLDIRRLEDKYSKDGPNAVVKNIKEVYNKQVAALEASHKLAIAIEQDKVKKLTARNGEVEKKLTAFKTLFEDGCLVPDQKTMKEAATKELMLERRAHEEMLVELANEYAKKIKAVKDGRDAEVEKALEKTKLDHQAVVDDLKSTHETAVNQLKSDTQAQVGALEMRIAAMEEEHGKETDKMEKALEGKRKQIYKLKDNVSDLKAEVRDLKDASIALEAKLAAAAPPPANKRRRGTAGDVQVIENDELDSDDEVKPEPEKKRKRGSR